MRARIAFSLAAALLAVLVSIPSSASADPVVVVRARREGAPAETTVVLRDSNGAVVRCTTTHGECEIRGVRPGRHTVSTVDAHGNESRAQSVLIPPDGKVSLFVAVPPERAANSAPSPSGRERRAPRTPGTRTE